jgi:hypothetical protein
MSDVPIQDDGDTPSVSNIPRPAFNYDNQGREVVPAASQPFRTNASGKPDWDFDNQGNERPRDEQGRYLTKPKADLLAQWEKEGTAASNIAKVLAAEQSMLAKAPTLQTQISSLPNDIQTVAADYLRLSPAGFGREDKRFAGFLDALSESQFEKFRGWFANLSADEQNAILDTVK